MKSIIDFFNWIFAISMPGFRSLCAALWPKPRPGWYPVPGPRSAGACLHKNNAEWQPGRWLKTISACFTRPPPDLTVRSQDTTRGYCQEYRAGLSSERHHCMAPVCFFKKI